VSSTGATCPINPASCISGCGTNGQILQTISGAQQCVTPGLDVVWDSPLAGDFEVVGIRGTSVPTPSGADAYLHYGSGTLSWNTAVDSLSATADVSLSGSTGAITINDVTGIQTHPWDSTAPTDAQLPLYNSSTVKTSYETMHADVAIQHDGTTTVSGLAGRNFTGVLATGLFMLNSASAWAFLSPTSAAGQVPTSDGTNWGLATLLDEYDTNSGGVATVTTTPTTVSTLTFSARAGHLDISADVPEVTQGSGGASPNITIQVFVGSTVVFSWAANPAATNVAAAGGSWHGPFTVPATTVNVSIVATTTSLTAGVDASLSVKSYGF